MKPVQFKIVGTCFYTGLPLARGGKGPGANLLRRTREHIIPTSSCEWNIIDSLSDINEVHAASFINNIVGNAPIIIKFRVKKLFENEDYSDFITVVDAVAYCRKKTATFLKHFKYRKHFPWQFKGCEDSETRVGLKKIYAELLTEEEIRLKAYMKD